MNGTPLNNTFDCRRSFSMKPLRRGVMASQMMTPGGFAWMRANASSPLRQVSTMKLAASIECFSGSIDDWSAKLFGAVSRIVGLLHLAKYAPRPDQWSIEVEPETVQAAIKLGHYFVPHAKAAYQQMGVDPSIENAKHLLRWLEQGVTESSFSRRDAFQATKGRFGKVADMLPALELLVDHGYVRPVITEKTNRPGRPPSTRYEVNPNWARHNSHNPHNSTSEDSGNSGT